MKLNQTMIGVSGTRDARPWHLGAAAWIGEFAALAGLPIVSGYAHGVDLAAHEAVLRHGGETLAVLPTGINKRYVRPELESFADRLHFASPFDPDAEWTWRNAMDRNQNIVDLSNVLVAIGPRDRGGTIDAVHKALYSRRPVVVMTPRAEPWLEDLEDRNMGIWIATTKAEAEALIQPILDSVA